MPSRSHRVRATGRHLRAQRCVARIRLRLSKDAYEVQIPQASASCSPSPLHTSRPMPRPAQQNGQGRLAALNENTAFAQLLAQQDLRHRQWRRRSRPSSTRHRFLVTTSPTVLVTFTFTVIQCDLLDRFSAFGGIVFGPARMAARNHPISSPITGIARARASPTRAAAWRSTSAGAKYNLGDKIVINFASGVPSRRPGGCCWSVSAGSAARCGCDVASQACASPGTRHRTICA